LNQVFFFGFAASSFVIDCCGCVYWLNSHTLCLSSVGLVVHVSNYMQMLIWPWAYMLLEAIYY